MVSFSFAGFQISFKKKPWPEFPENSKASASSPPISMSKIADTNYEEEYDDYHHNDEKTEGLVAGNNLPAGSSAPSPYHPRHQTSETSTIFSLSYTAMSTYIIIHKYMIYYINIVAVLSLSV